MWIILETKKLMHFIFNFIVEHSNSIRKKLRVPGSGIVGKAQIEQTSPNNACGLGSDKTAEPVSIL